jgi:hypothetical protein
MLMARKKRKKAASPPPRASRRLQPPKGGLAVRMYRHGLGDCFLLAFDRPEPDPPCYTLIDCGVHMRQTKGTARLREVMADLRAATGGTLDVVVATHEHADHLSGFVQKGSPFVTGGFEVKNVWVAWTEKPDDSQAELLRKKRGAARRTVEEAVEKLRQRNALAAAQLTGLMDFEDIPPNTLAVGARGSDKASRNEIALGLLTDEGEPKYCEPGETVDLPDVRNARAYVLGPPRSERLLRRDKPASGARRETYLTSGARLRAFLGAPALHAGVYKNLTEADLRHPFESTLRRRCRFDTNRSVTRPPKKVTSTRSFVNKHYFASGEEWRRIDTDWLNVAEQLALNLDNDTNNTSLTLAFEWGPVGRGEILLFVGDAQVGNWLSWRTRPCEVDGRTISADDLLKRTLVYKVGHHGSHNATVKRDPDHTSAEHPRGEPFGLELMPSRLIALIPVDQAAVRKKMPRPWHMPHTPLYRRLLEKADGRVLRSDGQSPASEGIPLASCVPSGPKPTRIPGLANAHWCDASAKFKSGRDCPLYYDLFFEP